jgi:hypothetical protein
MLPMVPRYAPSTVGNVYHMVHMYHMVRHQCDNGVRHQLHVSVLEYVHVYVPWYNWFVAKLARRDITERAGRARMTRGREGEEGESNASTRARCNLSSAVHYWNAAATISYLRDALLVQLLPMLN